MLSVSFRGLTTYTALRRKFSAFWRRWEQVWPHRHILWQLSAIWVLLFQFALQRGFKGLKCHVATYEWNIYCIFQSTLQMSRPTSKQPACSVACSLPPSCPFCWTEGVYGSNSSHSSGIIINTIWGWGRMWWRSSTLEAKTRTQV